MKYFIASDIHGSSANAKRLFDIIDGTISQGDKVVLLGDLYNHGPRNPLPEGYAPMEVASIFNAHKDIISVCKGNCDSEVDEMISEFDIIPDREEVFLGRRILFTHGHKCNVNLPIKNAKDGDMVFYGHFHKPNIEVKDGVIYVCVGAIGISPEGVDKSYCVLDEKKIAIYSLLDGHEIARKDLLC